MKKALLLGILGLTIGAVSSYGQGAVYLDNYVSSTFNPVLYHGTPIPTGWTAQLWYDPTANQNITGSIAADPTGTALPSDLNAAFAMATGAGSTAPFIGQGYFNPSASFLIQPGSATPAQNFYTIMVVAYNGADYNSSTARGHSAAVYIQDAAPNILGGASIGTFFASGTPMFSAFDTTVIPEPTTMALGGLGLAALMLVRRKKA